MQKKFTNTKKVSLFEEEMKCRKRNAMQKKFTLLPIRVHYLKKKSNAEDIQSVTNKGSLFEEEMKCKRRNTRQKKFTLLPIRGHYLKKKCNAKQEWQCRRNSLYYQEGVNI